MGLGLKRVGDQHRVVAVVAQHPVDLVGDKFGGLVPRDALPLVATAQSVVARAIGKPVFTPHGVLEPVGRQNMMALGTTASAAALLRIGLAVFMGVVALHAHNGAVLHLGAKGATATAVDPAGRRNPFLLRIVRLFGPLGLGKLVLPFPLGATSQTEGRCRRCRGDHEISARQFSPVADFRHRTSSPLLRSLLNATEKKCSWEKFPTSI